MTADRRSEEELYSLALGGDAEAESELRRRLVPGLYDFALRVSLDPAVAEGATELALQVGAAGERPAGPSMATWLLSRARDEVLEQLRSRDRGRGSGAAESGPLSPVDPVFSTLPPDSDGDEEIATWAWQAARAQRPRDYSLLDLSIRRSLSADEIAEATDMSHSGIYAILGRLRGFFEESFAATLLYHRGREGCPDMAAIAQSHASLGPAVRREITRHVEGCQACRRTRRSFPSPADLLAAFVPVPTPERLFSPATEDVVEIEEAAPEAGQVALPLSEAPLATAAMQEMETASEEEEARYLAAEEEGPLESLEEAAEVPEIEPVGMEEVAASGPRADEAETIAFSPEMSAADAVEDEEAFEEVSEAESEREDYEDDLETEPDTSGAALPIVASTAAIDAAQDGPLLNDRIQLTRGRFLAGIGGGSPPRRPWDRAQEWFSGQDPLHFAIYAVLVGAVVLAIYLGLALGNSIEGGNGNGSGAGLAALPTSTPGVRQIVCGNGPSTLDQGSKVRLDFDRNTLSGYQIKSDVAIQPVSANASAQAVTAVAVQPLSVEIEARAIPGTTARTDEYKILVTFTKAGERDIRSECTILVKVAAALTPTALAASPTAQATAVPTQRPAATAVPPTALPATATVPPSTPTSTSTVAVTNTAVATGTALGTATPTPTRTSTPNP
jgi:DNA-directed RNA polymerase specialized sigma24 family protein